jgi:hypothetical protein
MSQSPDEEAVPADTVSAASGQGESPDGDRAVVNEAAGAASPSGLPSLSQVERDELDALRLLRDTLGSGVSRSEFKTEIFALQRGAGFARPDTREVTCAGCQALGMNTGWGYWKFRCGAEVLSDGEHSSECGHISSERDRNPKGGDLLGSVEDESPVCEANSPNSVSAASSEGSLTPKCDCHLNHQQVCDICQDVMCQADSTAARDPVSASPLQSGDGGEAKWLPMATAPKPKVAHWGDAPLVLAKTKHDYADPVLARWVHHDQLWLISGGGGMRDEDLIGWLPLPNARSSDEEPQRGDTVPAASTEASLTQEITRLREDISRYVARDTERLAEVEKLREALKPMYSLGTEIMLAHEVIMWAWRDKASPDIIATIERLRTELFAAAPRARAVLTGSEAPQEKNVTEPLGEA